MPRTRGDVGREALVELGDETLDGRDKGDGVVDHGVEPV